MDQMPRLPRMEATIEQLQNALPLPTLSAQNPSEVAMLLSMQQRPAFYPIYHPMEPTPPWISDGQNALQSAFPYSMGTFQPQLIPVGSIGNFDLRGTPTPPVPPPGLRKPRAIRPETTMASSQNTPSMATISVPVFGTSGLPAQQHFYPVCTVASVQIGNALQGMPEVRTLVPQQGALRAIPSTTVVQEDFDLPISESQNARSSRILPSVQPLPRGAYPNPYAPQESTNRSTATQEQSFDLPVSSIQPKTQKKKKENMNTPIPLPPLVEEPRQPIETTAPSTTAVSTVTAATAQLKISAPSTAPTSKKVPKYVYVPLAESSLCKDMPELEPEEPLLPQQMRRAAPRGRPRKNVLTEINESRTTTPSTNWSNEAAEPSVCCSSPGRGLSPVRTRRTRAIAPPIEEVAPIEEVDIEDIPHYVNGKIQKKRTQLIKDRREPIPIKAGTQISKPKTQSHVNWVKYPSQKRMILLRYGLITIPSKIVLNAAGLSERKAGRRRKTIKGRGAPLQNFIRETSFRQKAEMILIEAKFLPNMEVAILDTSFGPLFQADMIFTTEIRDVLRELVLTTAEEVDFPFGMPGKGPKKKANRLEYTKSRSSNRVAKQQKKNYKIT